MTMMAPPHPIRGSKGVVEEVGGEVDVAVGIVTAFDSMVQLEPPSSVEFASRWRAPPELYAELRLNITLSPSVALPFENRLMAPPLFAAMLSMNARLSVPRKLAPVST